MLKNCLSSGIKFYRYFISPLKPASCRYYPTCSQYALEQLKANNIFLALFYSLFRILRCNPLFKGGIDYPVVFKHLEISPCKQKQMIRYFYIPCKYTAKSYVLKASKRGFFINKFFLIKKL